MSQLTFEQASEKLETLLSKLNSGEVPLEESLNYYEEADKLIGLCNDLLKRAEQKIQTLIKNRDGTHQLEPFE